MIQTRSHDDIVVTRRSNGGVSIAVGHKYLLFDRHETEQLANALAAIVAPRITRYARD